MKRIIFLAVFLICASVLKAQIYTPMKGTQITYLKTDSGFALPFRDTVLGRNVNRPGLVVCRPQDSLLYRYTGTSWELLNNGGGDYSNKVDSVTVTGDYLFYWINGSSYGYLLPTAGWGFYGNIGCDFCVLGTTGNHPVRFIMYDTIRAVIDTGGLFGIGTQHPDAILDVASTSSGVLLPRMTSAEMSAIATPITGMLVYNTTADSLYFYNSGGQWWPVGTGAAAPVQDLQDVTDISNSTTNNIIIDPGFGNSLDLGSTVNFLQTSGSRTGSLTKLSQTNNNVWSLPDKTGTILVNTDTATKWVNSITRTPGVDSIYFKIGGTTYAIKDSIGTGGGGGSTDTASLSNRIDLRVKYTDTSATLAPYVNEAGWGLTKSLQVLRTDTTAGKVATQTMLSTKANTFTLATTNTADATTYSSNIINVPLVDGYLSAALQVTNRYIDSSQNYVYADALKTWTKETVAGGVYQKIFLFNPFSGDSTCGNSCIKWNMIDPEDTNDAFRLTFPNGGSRTTKGFKFNVTGTDDYAESFFDWERATAKPYIGVSIYMQNTNPSGALIGTGVSSSYAVWFYDADAKAYMYIQGNSNGITVPAGNKKGYWMAQRTREDKLEMYRGGMYLLGQTFAIGTSTSSGQTIKLNYNYSTANVNTNEISLFIIHEMLTDTEQAILYKACEKLMTKMGRYIKP